MFLLTMDRDDSLYLSLNWICISAGGRYGLTKKELKLAVVPLFLSVRICHTRVVRQYKYFLMAGSPADSFSLGRCARPYMTNEGEKRR